MKISDFDYELNPDLIAQEPAKERNKSRLMMVDRESKTWKHCNAFSDIVDFLHKGDVLVLNNTKVLYARLLGHRQTGGKVDMLIIECNGDKATALIQTGKHPQIGEVYTFGSHSAKILGRNDTGWEVDFQGDDVFQIMEEIGRPPLPPYIKRNKEDSESRLKEDIERYQTIYAKEPGSVAAPTAGLHFTPELLQTIKNKGVEILYVTLHVGLGTFLPIREDEVEKHKMHREYYRITPEVAERINLALKENRRIIATGTTSCRTLEAAGRTGKIIPQEGSTDIFIYPGFEYKIVKALITNFHLPKSTLLLLVSAFAGTDFIRQVYKEAVEQKYRFFSYGDAMFIQ